MRFHVMKKMGKDCCPHFFSNLFLKMLTEGAETADAVIFIRHRKSWPSPAAVAHTLECLVAMASKAATTGREKKTSSDQHRRDP